MKSDKPLVSVIIPVYNVEKYLRECVDSVTTQTYTNLEIILSDDGATDSSGAICDELAATDSRIRVIHEENGGLSVARNRGLDIATGEYVVFVDSDDAIHPEMIEHLLRISNDTDSDLVTTKKPIATESVDWSMTDLSKEQIVTFTTEDSVRRFLMRFDNCAVWGCLFKRSIIGDLRFTPEIINEDEMFLAEVFPHCGLFAVSDQLFCFYRNNAGSLSRTMSKRKFDMITNAFAIDEKMARLPYDLTVERRHHIVTACVDYCMQVIKHHVMHEYRKEYVEARSHLRKSFWRNLLCSRLSPRYMMKMILAVIR